MKKYYNGTKISIISVKYNLLLKHIYKINFILIYKKIYKKLKIFLYGNLIYNYFI